jgi:hypothetical protein
MLSKARAGGRGKYMSGSKLRLPGRDEYLTFLRSNPRLVLFLAAGLLCLLVGVIIGIATDSPGAGLWGGTLLILGVAVLIDVGVVFYQWERARIDGARDLPDQPARAETSGPPTEG